MTDTTWPDPARPGFPLLPEMDRKHWLLLTGCTEPDLFSWSGKEWHCLELGAEGLVPMKTVVRLYSYSGPALTAAEVDVLRQALVFARKSVQRDHDELFSSCTVADDPEPLSPGDAVLVAEIHQVLEQIDAAIGLGKTSANLDGVREQAIKAAARIAGGWPCHAAGTDYQTSGNGRFWDAGTDYAQGRVDASAEILSELTGPSALGEEAIHPVLLKAERDGLGSQLLSVQRESIALRKAVNAYLAADGSRGAFDSAELLSARKRLEEILSSSGAGPPAPEFTEGVCGDGAAILRDGVPMTVSEILTALQEGARAS